MAQPYIFLDRDGTLNVEKHYLHKPEEVQLCDGVIDGLVGLRDLGYRFLVVTNQSGIGRGYYSESDMHAVNACIQELLKPAALEIDAFFFCPHTPEANCDCRKPKLGMFIEAQRNFSIDVSKSWMVGDKPSDIEFGKNAGLNTALVLSGYGANCQENCNPSPTIAALSLLDLAEKLRLSRCVDRKKLIR